MGLAELAWCEGSQARPGTKGSPCPFDQGESWAPSSPTAQEQLQSRGGGEDLDPSPPTQPGEPHAQSTQLHFPLEIQIPVKRWRVSMFLIKLKSIKLCFPMTNQGVFPLEKGESKTW